MDNIPNERKIDVFVFNGVNILDVAGPIQAFDTVQHDGVRAYKSRYVSIDGEPVKASCGLSISADAKLSRQSHSDDLLIPGGEVDDLLRNQDLLEIIANWAKRPGRLISICSGSLVLAAADALNGKTATTHWSREAATREFPNVNWELDRISTECSDVYTSAGVTTGIDLALYIIRKDFGNEVALQVARELVVQLRRTGGQSQHAIHLAGQFAPCDPLASLIESVVTRPDQNWTMSELAREGRMNSRTLSRKFKRHLSTSPGEFVERVRIDHARGLMNENFPLQTIAAKSGFGDLQRMRRAFKRRLGLNPEEYAKKFRI